MGFKRHTTKTKKKKKKKKNKQTNKQTNEQKTQTKNTQKKPTFVVRTILSFSGINNAQFMLYQMNVF